MSSFQESSSTHITENTVKDREAVLMGRDQEKIWSGETRNSKVSERLLTVKFLQNRTS